MDDSQNPIPPNELDPTFDSGRTSSVPEGMPAEFARSRERAALPQQHYSDHVNLCRDDFCSEGSIVGYCGSEEEVAQGFLHALLAMGVVEVEQPPEPEKPPLARAKL
jgi:hypothetical protein